MKRFTSVFLTLAILLTLAPLNIFATENAPFSDVSGTEYFSVAATALEELEILSGYPDGTFGADRPITRAEMTAIVCRMIDKENEAEKATGKTVFDDVAPGHWASGYINVASDKNIINGDGDGNFRPDDNVNYEEAIKMVVCTLGFGNNVTVDDKDWSAGYLKVANEKGITDNLKGSKGMVATRGDIAVMSYNGLTTDLVAPTASLESGNYTGTKNVTLTTATEGAAIYYTTDGTTPTVNSTKYTKPVSISKTCTLKAVTVKDGVLVSDVMSVEYTIKRSSGGGVSSSSTKYTVSFDLNYDGATDAPASQTVNSGAFATKPTAPQRDGYQFAGWFEDKDETEYKNTFSFVDTAITKNTTLYAIWVNLTMDTDGDGLVDDLELYAKTDKTKKDTDGDNLTDYQEVVELGTNPLKIDSDDNGTSDFDEDRDSDGLSNGEEYANGTNPTHSDTDNDSLDDYSELNIYNTSPINGDTDNDGANDGWEIENNYDPCEFNSTFNVSQNSEEVTSSNPVSASVSVMLEGEQVTTLSVEPVSVADNPLISSSIPGYLGKAYDFNVDGDFSSATLTFEYDTSLGSISEDFQPRIYYFNDSTQELEELENQTVENGKVIANTTHFSTYILLNKVEFDKVWNEEIKKPITDGSGATFKSIDVAFAIDVSGSMRNDRISTAKSALSTFINALQENDRAGLVKFNEEASTLINLTNNKDEVKNYVSSLYADGMTSMYNGFENALNLLTVPDEEYGYKMIIILSDGRDEPSTNYQAYYQSLVNTAVENNIVVYTIGVGSNVDTSILTQIAENTNGAYYHATSSSEITDIFFDLQEETVDLTTDSNSDGIPDYYNELIKNGQLVLSNGSDEFKGIDFNENADFDNDGLLNGEELQIINSGNKVYMILNSDPMMAHSDRDGIDDYTEYHQGTDPLLTELSSYYFEFLTDNNNWYYEDYVAMYDDSTLYQLDSAFLSTVFGVWNHKELYRDIMVDFFDKYTDQNYVNDTKKENEQKIMVENIEGLLTKAQGIKDDIGDIKGYVDLVSDIKNLISVANGYVTNIDSIAVEYIKIVEKIAVYDPSVNTIKMTTYSMSSTSVSVVTSKSPLKAGKVSGISVVLDIAGGAIDIADTWSSFATINANAEAFDKNMDVLLELRDYGNRTVAQDAASDIVDALGEGYGNALSNAIGSDFGELTANLVITAASANPYVAAVKFVRDTIDILTGLSPTLKREYQMLCYNSMASAVKTLISENTYKHNDYYYMINDEDVIRYLTNLANIRLYGEDKYLEFYTNGMNSWFTDEEATAEKINTSKNNVYIIADELGLNI